MNNSIKVKGYTLVELTVVIIIIGIIFSLLYKYYPRANQVQQRTVETSNTEYIDNAIIGFSYAHGRLPFPDADLDGDEDPGTLFGTIPELTLGLAEKPINDSSIPLNYSIFNKADADVLVDAELGVSKDRLYPLLPTGVRTAAPTALNQSNTIDFCFALRSAAATTTVNNAGYLHVSETSPVLYNRNIAYVLVDAGGTDADGDGNLLDGFNANAIDFKFEVATKPQSAGYDDQVNSMEFSELFGALACGSVISAALHAHDNTVLAADMMWTSFVDYENLLDLTEQLAEADVALGVAAIAQALAGDADVVAGVATAIAESLTPPLTAIGAPAAVSFGLAAVLAVAATAAAIATTVLAADALSSINDATDCFEDGDNCAVGDGDFVERARLLRVEIRANAIRADQEGL